MHRALVLSGLSLLSVFLFDPSAAQSAAPVGQTASFSRPLGITIDQNGVLYVADTDNHTIRKITPAGVVTTLAGAAGAKGNVDGKGSEARFNAPSGIAADREGVLYVADSRNNIIRKIDSQGMVTTLAGQAGVEGNNDGDAKTARFNNPYGITVDGAHNLFVTDGDNDTVRKITPNGAVTTLGGKAGEMGTANGSSKVARFRAPRGITVDKAGNVYVCDAGNNTIRKITPNGTVSLLAGNDAPPEVKTGETPGQSYVVKRFSDGKGSAAGFERPIGMTIEAGGALLVTDSGNGTLRRITPDGTVTTLAGSPRATLTGGGSAKFLRGPEGLAVDAAGNCYVIVLNSILKMDPNGNVVTLAGETGRGHADGAGYVARFKSPAGVAVDSKGVVYLADHGNDLIRKITPEGMVWTVAGIPDVTKGEDGRANVAKFSGPDGIAVDKSGNIFVSDSLEQTIRQITPDGMVTTLAGEAGKEDGADGVGKAAHFDNPHGLAVDKLGNVYVADSANSAVRKITPDGTVTTLAGSRGHEGNGDGKGTEAHFVQPEGVAVDGAGNVWVADGRGNTIRRISPDGEVTSLSDKRGTRDEKGRLPRLYFDWPESIAVDEADNVYVSELGTETVRKIAADGTVTTVAGKPKISGAIDGKGEEARFNRPAGLAIDASGNLYLTELRNQTIRKIAPDGTVTTLAGKFGVEGDADGLARGPAEEK